MSKLFMSQLFIVGVGGDRSLLGREFLSVRDATRSRLAAGPVAAVPFRRKISTQATRPVDWSELLSANEITPSVDWDELLRSASEIT